MASEDNFQDLERHVLQLEANVKELKSTLEHWRTWDAEYEALKEDVSAASRDGQPEAAGLARVRAEFEGDLVKGKDMAEIFGEGRSAGQVLGVLGRRLDYVGTNVRTLEKRVEQAEAAVDAARLVGADEEELPITEIFESLDEEGNVLSHETWTPGSKQAQVDRIMEKAAVANGSVVKAEVEEVLDTPGSKQAQVDKMEKAAVANGSVVKADVEEVLDASPDESNNRDEQRLPAKSPPAPKAKPTASTRKDSPPTIPQEDKKVKTQVEVDEQPESAESTETSKAAQRVQRIMDRAKEQEDLSKAEAVVPASESEEDAELRRQMLDYGMSHSAGGMGEVVAVMKDLRFDDESDDDEFNSFSEDDEDEDEDEAEEDKWGRATGRTVGGRYQDRMLELEQRLGVQSRFTRKLAEDADADEDEDEKLEEGIGKISISGVVSPPKKSARDAEPPASGVLKADDAPKGKKSVRFAGGLDIAPETKPSPPKPAPKRPETENPVADLIVEQTGSQPEPAPPAETKPKKQSRFKQMKSAAPKPAAGRNGGKKPSEEEGITVDLTWAETAPEKDLGGDVDDEIERREVTDEYQRRRRRMIESQGGFLKEDEIEVERVVEGDVPHVSKFRAARLSRQ